MPATTKFYGQVSCTENTQYDTRKFATRWSFAEVFAEQSFIDAGYCLDAHQWVPTGCVCDARGPDGFNARRSVRFILCPDINVRA